VVDIQAATGKRLVEWFLIAAQTNTAATNLRVTVTYSDATSTNFDSAAATAHQMFANAGGGMRMAAGIPDNVTAFSAKDVTRLQVTTLGTGTGTRYATVSATEVS